MSTLILIFVAPLVLLFAWLFLWVIGTFCLAAITDGPWGWSVTLNDAIKHLAKD